MKSSFQSQPMLWIGGGALAAIGLVAAVALGMNSGGAGDAQAGVDVALAEKKQVETAPNVKSDYEAAQKGAKPSDPSVMTKVAESKNTGEPAMNIAKAPGGLSIDAIALGDPNAPVTVIEYGSLTCGHCRQFHEASLPKLKTDYIDKGDVRWIFRPYSLNGVDVHAGLLVACVPAERRVAMLDVLYKQQRSWVPYDTPQDQILAKLMGNLKSIARPAGLTDATFDACMVNENHKKWLQSIQSEGERAHEVAGLDRVATPSFVINGKLHQNMPWNQLKKLIDDELKSAR